jgi:hypothetical protein
MPEHRTVNEHGQVIVEVPVHRNNTPYLLLCGGKYAGAWYGRLRIGDSSDDVADRSRAADLKGQEGTLQAMASGATQWTRGLWGPVAGRGARSRHGRPRAGHYLTLAAKLKPPNPP